MATEKGATPEQRALGGISDALGRIRSCLFGLRDLGDADKQWVDRAVKVAQEEIEDACEAEVARRICVRRDDDMPAYAAWLAGADDNTILFNVRAHVRAAEKTGADLKSAAVQTLMHEFGHALEEWWGLEFSEERVQQIAESYGGEEKREATHDEKDAAHALLQTLFYEVEEQGSVSASRLRDLAENYGFHKTTA